MGGATEKLRKGKESEWKRRLFKRERGCISGRKTKGRFEGLT